MHNFKSWYLMSGSEQTRICSTSLQMVPHLLRTYSRTSQMGCAHWGAHNAEALYLDYIKVLREHGAEGLKGARLVSVDTITDKLVCAFLWDAWHVESAFA